MIIKFLRRLFRWKRKETRISVKCIYNFQQKTYEQILKALDVEVARLLKNNPGFVLKGFSKPTRKPDGSLYYIIKLEKK